MRIVYSSFLCNSVDASWLKVVDWQEECQDYASDEENTNQLKKHLSFEKFLRTFLQTKDWRMQNNDVKKSKRYKLIESSKRKSIKDCEESTIDNLI